MARFMNHCCEPCAYARIISGAASTHNSYSNSRNYSNSSNSNNNKGGRRGAVASTFGCPDVGAPPNLELGSYEEDLFDGCEAVDDTQLDSDRHIVIIAARDIQEGEEITYDYKFPIEEKKLKCYCGAPKCQGSMN